MKTSITGASVFVWVLCCLPASAHIQATFSLDDALQKSTHVALLEAGRDGFRVVESWAGDLAPGAVLDCLDLYCANQARYELIASQDQLQNPDSSSSKVSGPVCVDGLVFVPEGARVILFLREIRGDSAMTIPTAELLPDRSRRFACVSTMSPSSVTSLVWIHGKDLYNFAPMMGDGPQRPEVLNSDAGNKDGRHVVKLDELKELVTARQGKGEPAEREAGTAEGVEWRARVRRMMKACAFKDVKLRLFRDGKVSAAGYETVTGQILGARFILPARVVPDGGVLLCVPDDQTDPIVVKGLPNHVSQWTSKQQAGLFDGDFSMESRMAAQVLDALGAPIPNAQVSLSMQQGYGDSASEPVPLSERTTDADGRVQLLVLPPNWGNADRNAGWRYAPLNVSCANYGLAKVQYDPYVTNDDGKIRTSLVREGSEARERALRGVVVDSKMRPVAGATVISESIRPSGLLINGYGVVVTDNQGGFCLYLPERHWAGQRGHDADLVPVRSEYSYQVIPPKGSGLRSAGGWVSNSEPTTISLESDDAFAARSSFHTFAFEGGFPESTRPGGRTQVAVSGSDVEFGINLLASGEEHQIPYGTYYARITTGSNAIHFEPMVVNSESPKELNFRRIHAHCAGRVINGVTGKPIPGALCLVGSISWIPLRLSFDDLSDDLRKAMAAPSPDKDRIEQLAEPLGKDFPLMKAVVTDHDGRYEIAAPPGREVGIVYAIAEGCVPAGRHVYSGNPSVDNQINLDPIPLYPAGQARVRIVDDTPNGQYSITWLADEAATADWGAPLKGREDGSRYSLELMVGRIEGEKREGTFLLPARVPLHLTIFPPNDRLIPARMTNSVRVEPGQVTDLGEVRFAKAVKIPAVFRVVDAQGKPVEGVPIRKLNYSSWSLPTLTDADGFAKFDVVPGIVEKVGILSAGPDMIFAVTPELSRSAKIEHTFKLSPEQLKKALAH